MFLKDCNIILSCVLNIKFRSSSSKLYYSTAFIHTSYPETNFVPLALGRKQLQLHQFLILRSDFEMCGGRMSMQMDFLYDLAIVYHSGIYQTSLMIH